MYFSMGEPDESLPPSEDYEKVLGPEDMFDVEHPDESMRRLCERTVILTGSVVVSRGMLQLLNIDADSDLTKFGACSSLGSRYAEWMPQRVRDAIPVSKIMLARDIVVAFSEESRQPFLAMVARALFGMPRCNAPETFVLPCGLTLGGHGMKGAVQYSGCRAAVYREHTGCVSGLLLSVPRASVATGRAVERPYGVKGQGVF